MQLGYNTNGFAHHQLADAINILSECGYTSVAITPDVHHLNPLQEDIYDKCTQIRLLLDQTRMHCVIETGSRFLLNAKRKHWPTLLSRNPEDRLQRMRFLTQCMDVAVLLGSKSISFWSGTPDAAEDETVLWDRLVDGCKQLLDEAERRDLLLAFEPEPGMFIDRMDRFSTLYQSLNHPRFGLALDMGHLFCQKELPLEAHIHQWSGQLFVVHLEDMKRDVHDHLMFGDGEMQFPPIFAALQAIQYQHGVYVELSRHSHDAVRTAQHAYRFLLANGFPALTH